MDVCSGFAGISVAVQQAIESAESRCNSGTELSQLANMNLASKTESGRRKEAEKSAVRERLKI